MAEVRKDRMESAEAYRIQKSVSGPSPLQIKLQSLLGRIGGEIENRWLQSFKEEVRTKDDHRPVGQGFPSVEPRS
jgi:hypothetical protein